MAVIIKSVDRGSVCERAGFCAGDTLVSLNGNEITDVLDYRFYQNNEKIKAVFINAKGKTVKKTIKKDEYEELGLNFDTYLMDKKRSCKNKCIFCFIDQLPKGLRETLYFKDDDSRLSFLFGNYITLTNITEREIERIIKMHISPINISVHTTNPELRARMMNNKTAGEALGVMKRFNDAGIRMNCQLVLCPEINDGKELIRSLEDLSALQMVECIAAVPVGLTKFREGLTELKPFDKASAQEVIEIIDRFGEKCIEQYGERRIYAADEFYLLSGREIPNARYYGDFLQLENGVGLWALLLDEVKDALADITVEENTKPQKISIATGVAAYPLIKDIARKCEGYKKGLECQVFQIKNNFFGEKITVAGLITATDIYEQLEGKDLGEKLLIPSAMLRNEGDMFLDSVTVEELSQKLSVEIIPVDNSGYELVNKILDI